MNLKSNKGSITLFVVIAMLAFIFFTLATYTLLSRRNQTQIGLTKGIKDIYGDLAEDAEYESYFKGEVVPIYTIEELKLVGSGKKVAIDKEDGKIYDFSPDATYVLKNNIDLNEGKYIQNADGTITYNEGAELDLWIPIGTETEPFTGFFEGMGYTISGLYINTTEPYQGLFGYIKGGIVNNVKVSGEITSTSSVGCVGGIVGKADGQETTAYKISKCTNYVQVNVIPNETSLISPIGGIVGTAYPNGTIENCNNNAYIVGRGNAVGGIVGDNSAVNTVQCKNTGKIEGVNYVAGIGGLLHGGTNVEKCINKGEISGTSEIGGIAGRIGNSPIKYCVNEGNVTGKNWIAGIAALKISTNAYGEINLIENCYNIGNIVAERAVAGIIASIDGEDTSKIINSYNIGMVSGDGYYGPIIAKSENVTIENCNYLLGTASTGTTTFSDSKGAVEVRSDEFMKSKYFTMDLGTENWKIVEGINNGYPILYWQEGERKEPEFTTVSTAQALKDFAHIVNDIGETFEGKIVNLMEDIDLSTVCSATLGNWEPIGNYATNTNLIFKGTFNGNTKTISNIYINNTSANVQGLFGATKNCNINNLTVEGNVDANAYIAGIIGYDLYEYINEETKTRITNCTNKVNVNGIKGIGGVIGGVSGIKDANNNIIGNAIISGCTNEGAICADKSNSNSKYIGGIAGAGQLELIENCTNSGEVEGYIYVGGICGIANSINNKTKTCLNTGNISGYHCAGGITGCKYMDGSINNCYNTGTIKASYSYAGGIVGDVREAGSAQVQNSYNIGNISTPAYCGGIIGNLNTNVNVSNCYYLEGTALGGTNNGDIVGQAEVQTSATMKTTNFVDMLGNSNWKLVEGVNNGYPILTWQNGMVYSPVSNAWLYKSNNLAATGDSTKNEDGSITLKNEQTQYGPYITLEAGTYQVRYSGSNLSNAYFNVYTVYNTGTEGQKEFEMNKTTVSDTSVVYTFNVTSYTTDVEFICTNTSADLSDITINFIELIKLN